MRERMMFIRLMVLAVLTLGIHARVAGQTDVPLSHYVTRIYSINPATAGLSDQLAVQMTGIQQIAGVNDGPISSTLTVNSPVYNSQMAWGIGTMIDKFGPTTNLQLHLNYSHLVKISDFSLLSLGVRACLDNYQVKFSDISLENPNDPLFDSNIEGAFQPNFGFGSYFYTNDYFVGISMPRMLQSAFRSDGGGVFQNRSRPIFITGGYYFDVSKKVTILTSFLSRTSQDEPSISDVSIQLYYGSVLSAGIGFRFQRALVFLLGADFGATWKLAYAYDHNIGDIANVKVGKHELTLQYNYTYDWLRSARHKLMTKKKKESMKSLRYF